MLRRLLTHGAPEAVAWADHSNTLVLRMDDPGGAQNVFDSSWCYPKLDEPAWLAVGRELEAHDGRLSVCYVSGWVDDGDPERGLLTVDGRAVPREPGRVHPSPAVRYEDLTGHRPGSVHDYGSEYRGIVALGAEGLADVELHGYTHMHPDGRAWAVAADRYEGWPQNDWYRELGTAAEATLLALPAAQPPLRLGVAALVEHFGSEPTTLISPGDQWTNDALERVLDLGIGMVSSYYLATRDGEHLAWSTHICAPYLDEPDARWFRSGLPVIGYFHDRDLAIHGVDWLGRQLDAWQRAGARRFISLRELAATAHRSFEVVDRDDGEIELTVHAEGAPPLVRAIPVLVRVPRGAAPRTVLVRTEERTVRVPAEPVEAGVVRVSVEL